MNTSLSAQHRSAFDAVFQQPVSRSLSWADLRSLLLSVADSVQEDSDKLKLFLRSESLILQRPQRNIMVSVPDMLKARQFLKQLRPLKRNPTAEGVHLLVVIDHRLARIYRTEMKGTIPQRIVPHDPTGSGRHLHRVEDEGNGQRKPEQKSFYVKIAEALQGAEQILVFGSGTGASSAMDHLLAELEKNNRLSGCVVGALGVNEQHLTENQLLAKARDFYKLTSTR